MNVKWLTNVFARGVLLDDTETNDKSITNRSRHHVQFARSIDVSQQFLVEFVDLFTWILRASHKAEANQTQLKEMLSSINTM